MLVWEISWLHLRMGNVIKALTMQQAKRVIRSELARTAGVFQFCAQANEPFRVRDLSGQGVLNLAGGAIVMRADYLRGQSSRRQCELHGKVESTKPGLIWNRNREGVSKHG